MQFNYQIALTNVAFDNSYNNVLRFATRSEQEAYFDTNTLFLNKEFINFNATNLLTTNIVYDIGPDESIQKMLNCNYCIVKDSSPSKTLNYYYYFITNAVYLNDKQISVALELDVINTYYIDLQFSDCLIEKGHLNRVVENEDGTVSFDGTVDSKLFEREDIRNVAKRLTKRTTLGLYDTSNEIGAWLANNVSNWIYIYWDVLHDYNWLKLDSTKQVTSSKAREFVTMTKNGVLPSNICLFAYPIYKSNKIIKFNANNGFTNNIAWGDWTSVLDRTYSQTALQKFANITGNDGYSYIFTTKTSIVPPFNTIPSKIDYTIDNQGNLVINANVSASGAIFNPLLSGLGTGDAETKGVGTDLAVTGKEYASTISLIKSQNTNIIIDYTIDKMLNFAKNEIVNANKSIKFNPKLLASDYFNIRISDNTENGFDYDVQKLNKTNLKIGVVESLTPDIAKRYIRIVDNNGVYIKDTEENLTGFLNSNDNSILMPTSAYQSMLANNKNYFLQNSINRQFNLAQGLASGGLALASGAMSKNPLALIGGAITGVNVAANYAKDVISQNLTVDNLQNAPSAIVAAKGNATFENMYSANGVIVEEYDILPNEKQMINDFMCQYGFTVNRLDNPKNYDNIRHFYNYVRASLENITSNLLLSNAVRAKIKEIYANGVRFWNVFNNQTPSFNYNKENYERWLNNE